MKFQIFTILILSCTIFCNNNVYSSNINYEQVNTNKDSIRECLGSGIKVQVKTKSGINTGVVYFKPRGEATGTIEVNYFIPSNDNSKKTVKLSINNGKFKLLDSQAKLAYQNANNYGVLKYDGKYYLAYYYKIDDNHVKWQALDYEYDECNIEMQIDKTINKEIFSGILKKVHNEFLYDNKTVKWNHEKWDFDIYNLFHTICLRLKQARSNNVTFDRKLLDNNREVITQIINPNNKNDNEYYKRLSKTLFQGIDDTKLPVLFNFIKLYYVEYDHYIKKYKKLLKKNNYHSAMKGLFSREIQQLEKSLTHNKSDAEEKDLKRRIGVREELLRTNYNNLHPESIINRIWQAIQIYASVQVFYHGNVLLKHKGKITEIIKKWKSSNKDYRYVEEFCKRYKITTYFGKNREIDFEMLLNDIDLFYTIEPFIDHSKDTHKPTIFE